MMTNKEAINTLNESKADLLQTLSAFTPEQLNTVPFEGSWTAGQVTEHLLMSSSGVPGVLHGDTQATDRPVDALTGAISDIFLDYTTKLQSPDFILPSEGPHDKDALMSSMKEAMEEIESQAGSVDLTTLCLAFPFPQLGELTGLEWLHFVACHTKRHTQQIKNIYRTLTAATAS